MELGLALGRTAGELSHMPLLEMEQWRRFMRRRMFPHQRIERLLVKLVSSWSGEKEADLYITPLQSVDGIDDEEPPAGWEDAMQDAIVIGA